MKRTFAAIMLAAIMASSAFGANFSPNVLKISAPTGIRYDFDGKTLNIPVTVAGSQANVIFLVFTKDKAASISKVRNGFMGWHYVNKIDTCLYVSRVNALGKGSNVISWDGKDEGGSLVGAGEYTYYLWGYDGVNTKTLAVDSITWPHATHGIFNTHDVDGAPKAQPVFYLSNGTKKWIIGADPMDSTLVETTSSVSSKQFLLDPADHGKFFIQTLEKTRGNVSKWTWVPNGKSVPVTDWGTDNGVSYFHSGTSFNHGGMAFADDKIIVGLCERDNPIANTVLCYLDMQEGNLLRTIDVSDRWFSVDEHTLGGQYAGGPGQIYARNNRVFLSQFNACYREMIDPSIEDIDEYVVWGNDNGDYVGDHNFDPTSTKKWVCFDYNVAPYSYTTDADENMFSSFGAYDLGAVSFGLIAPDGTGIGYFALAGETAKYKQGTLFCDYGSPYDGIYTDNASSFEKNQIGRGMWFIGHDSIKGTIGTQIGVKESAPAAFSIAQNVPNPFNPSTTISFTLAKAGKTTVEVFNAAGQKVDTILNANLSAGSHSVTWNASRRSAGVYFYTVKNGESSRTMKMTLVK
ncbi:MAG: FlgD immunoglobulin-like domain containing protein [Candidatus Latescibacterota bacterium]